MSKSTSHPCIARNFALFACLVALAAPLTTAQTQTPQRREGSPVSASPTPSPSPAAATTATDNLDLSITANVTARELRFEVVPNPTVEFPGQPRRATVWEAERTNLPEQVQPGVTYRDIGIRLRITSVFADIERIVAEALGEIPVSGGGDSTPPTPEPNANALPAQTGNAPRALIGATQTATLAAAQTNAVTPSVSTTQTSRASSAQTTPASRRKVSRHAPGRRRTH